MRNKRRLYAIALLAIIWVGSVNPQSRAGIVSGTVEGTADISIAPIIAGQYPPVSTVYQDVPSVLTYSYDITEPYPYADFVRFSITNSVYSLNTANFLGQTYPVSYSIYSVGSVERMDLSSFTYHVYSLQADLEFSLSDYTLVGGGYFYSASDTHGDGQNVTAWFTPSDPPAGVPEPSSVVMEASAAIVVFAVCLVRAHRVRDPRPTITALASGSTARM